MDRTLRSAGSTGPLLPRVQLTDSGNTCAEKQCRAEWSGTVPPGTQVFRPLERFSVEIFQAVIGPGEIAPGLGSSPECQSTACAIERQPDPLAVREASLA